MRNLANLLEGRDRVWFWIGDDKELQRCFINDCVSCGCKMSLLNNSPKSQGTMEVGKDIV